MKLSGGGWGWVGWGGVGGTDAVGAGGRGATVAEEAWPGSPGGCCSGGGGDARHEEAKADKDHDVHAQKVPVKVGDRGLAVGGNG